jgi:DNA-binding NtrC family response regulator
MEKAKSASPQTVFVVMTAFGTISSAVSAIKKGAENYLTKPLDYEALSAVVERAMEKAKLLQETLALRERLRERNAFGHIVTEDPKMRSVLDLVENISLNLTTTLLSTAKVELILLATSTMPASRIVTPN